MSSTTNGESQTPFSQLKPSTSDLNTLTEELKRINQSPAEYWYAMGSRLQKVLDERLYRMAGYRSFSEYCTRGVGYSRQHVYKLISAVQFIDELWAQAKTEEARTKVHRLFNLGFTKLYLLHFQSPTVLDRMLREGVAITDNALSTKTTITLEEASTAQLKHVLKGEPISTPNLSLKKLQIVPFMLKPQADTLLSLINQCQKQLDDRNMLAEQLRTAQEYATSIVQIIDELFTGQSKQT
jgi:hypothetical protein